ncbi:hypothetical protein GGF31_005959 [Allomyces arbusculus]|nr:hypothetical protein GGF31_005959 [Allomyces arbusculus]
MASYIARRLSSVTGLGASRRSSSSSGHAHANGAPPAPAVPDKDKSSPASDSDNADKTPAALEPPHPFTFTLTDDMIDDLRDRVRRTRWPDEMAGSEWTYGVPKSELMALADYWANEFDFRKHFDRINSYPHFTTTVNGVPLHFIHARSSRTDAVPLLLIHGWPGSFVEFLDIIPMLTNPPPHKPAFHVVVPSLPGYGFSPAPKQPGFGTQEMARVFNLLMIKLGYLKYLAQGGDWGSIIARQLAVNHVQNCVGIHINLVVVPPPKSVGFLPYLLLIYAGKGSYVLSKQELKWLEETQDFLKKYTAYQKIQATTPQTPAYALNDSPVGLLAWLYEKFSQWTHQAGEPDLFLPRDTMLTNISLYWFTQTIASSMRLYKEDMTIQEDGSVYSPSISARITAPVGCAVFPKEIMKVPQSWAKFYFNVQHWAVHNRGGHFIAMEEPALLAEEVQACFGAWMEKGVVTFKTA